MAEVFFKFMEYTRYGFIPEEELGFGFTRYLCIYIYIYSFWLNYATNPKSAEIKAFGDDSPNPASFQ